MNSSINLFTKKRLVYLINIIKYKTSHSNINCIYEIFNIWNPRLVINSVSILFNFTKLYIRLNM